MLCLFCQHCHWTTKPIGCGWWELAGLSALYITNPMLLCTPVMPPAACCHSTSLSLYRYLFYKHIAWQRDTKVVYNIPICMTTFSIETKVTIVIFLRMPLPKVTMSRYIDQLNVCQVLMQCILHNWKKRALVSCHEIAYVPFSRLHDI